MDGNRAGEVEEVNMEKWFAVSAFFDSEKKIRQTLVRLLQMAVPRDLIEVVISEGLEKQFYIGAQRTRMSRSIADAGRGALIGLIVLSFASLILIATSGARDNERLLFIMLLGPNIGVLGGAVVGLLWGLMSTVKVPPRYQRAKEQRGILLVVRAKEKERAEELLRLVESHGGENARVETT